jgi:hypothetical protein
MKGLIIYFTVAVGIGGVFGLMRLRAHRANLEKELAELQRQQRRVEWVRQENERLRAVAAQTEVSDVDSADARQRELERLRREVIGLEQRALAQSRRVTATNAAETNALATNRDPEQGMTRLEHFRNVGRDTPRAAFQTLVWAAMKGDEQALAGALTMPDSARQKADALLARLPDDARKRYPNAESLAAIAVAGEMLKGGAIELPGHTLTDVTNAIVQIRTQGGAKEVKLPMRLGPGGWQFVVPERAIDAIARRLVEGSPDGTPK